MKIEPELLNAVKYNAEGLVPAIVQSKTTGRVLMLAWMNSESLAKSIEIGETVFFSRSRSQLWHKGETSGNTQKIERIELDCDGDSLLFQVLENGPACHNGTESCFDTTRIAGE